VPNATLVAESRLLVFLDGCVLISWVSQDALAHQVAIVVVVLYVLLACVFFAFDQALDLAGVLLHLLYYSVHFCDLPRDVALRGCTSIFFFKGVARVSVRQVRCVVAELALLEARRDSVERSLPWYLLGEVESSHFRRVSLQSGLLVFHGHLSD